MQTRRDLLALAALAPLAARAGERALLLGSSTTTENSGFLAHLLPLFEAETGVSVRVVVAGTGRILQLLESGDLDAALTHYPDGEARLVASGGADARHPVMVNDFLLVGPPDDPARAADAVSARGAFAAIAAAGAVFLSRGDESGTHRMERAQWPALPPQGANAPGWYRETGAGMGATLNIAAATGGYTLVDRATWATFGNRAALTPIYENPAELPNEYALLTGARGRHPHLNAEGADKLAGWLSSDRGHAAIAAFRPLGEALFAPAAAPGRP